MKQTFMKLLVICAVCFSLTATFLAQNTKKPSPSTVKDTYVISAKAGAVNFISGNVSIARQNGQKNLLSKRDTVEVGDKVSTEDGSRAEILLNPGSFVRINGNSEFEFLTTDLDDLRVKLNKGSAILEVITTKEFRVSVNTDKSQFFIVESGIYRVDALEDGTAKLEVWKGKAQVGQGKGTNLKGGQTTVINSSQVAVAKFDRDDKDEFELWSKDRAKELDKINAKLRGRDLNRALINSYTSGIWSASNGFGLWVRDPFSQSYCFLPYGMGWSSPYGYSFDRSLWSNTQPAYQNNNNNNNPGWNSQNNGQSNPGYQGNPSGGGGMSSPSTMGNSGRSAPTEVRPEMRVDSPKGAPNTPIIN